MAGLFAQYLPQPTVLVFEVFLIFLGAAALALAFIPETVTGRRRLSLRFTGLAIPAEGRGEFIAAGVAAFAAYALNGLFASLVPGFTTVMLHHPDYAVAGGVTCLFFAAGTVAALGLAPFNSRPVLLGGLGLFPVGLALVVAGMSATSLTLFLVGAVVAGSAFGAVVISSLSAANRLAAPETRAKAISTYFVFAYAGLSIPVVGVGVASDYVGSFRAVLGCSVVLAGLCVFSAALGARAAGRLSAELGDTERAPARLPSKNARGPDATRPLALSSPGLPGLRMRWAAELDDDGRGGAAGAARERAAARQTFYPLSTREDSWPVPCGPSRCRPETRSRCSARAPGASARVGLAAARRLPRCAVVWTSA
jgi:hypothetical protein